MKAAVIGLTPAQASALAAALEARMDAVFESFGLRRMSPLAIGIEPHGTLFADHMKFAVMVRRRDA